MRQLMHPMAGSLNQVHEMQGLYGPFTIAERVVQKIWLRRDFVTDRAVLADGQRLEIRSPGTWNLLGGPDFRGARLLLDGREITGDIEVHFHVSDWRAHGHEADRATLTRYITNGLRVFLKAYSTHPAQDLDQLAALTLPNR